MSSSTICSKTCGSYTPSTSDFISFSGVVSFDNVSKEQFSSKLQEILAMPPLLQNVYSLVKHGGKQQVQAQVFWGKTPIAQVEFELEAVYPKMVKVEDRIKKDYSAVDEYSPRSTKDFKELILKQAMASLDRIDENAPSHLEVNIFRKEKSDSCNVKDVCKIIDW